MKSRRDAWSVVRAHANAEGVYVRIARLNVRNARMHEAAGIHHCARLAVVRGVGRTLHEAEALAAHHDAQLCWLRVVVAVLGWVS